MSYDVMLMRVGELQRQRLGEFMAICMTEVMFAFLISKHILSLVLTCIDIPEYNLWTIIQISVIFFLVRFLLFIAASEFAIYFATQHLVGNERLEN